MIIGTTAAIAAASPWGGYIYREQTLDKLTKTIGEISRETADALAGPLRSLTHLLMLF